MKRRTRRVLFVLFLLMFAVAATVILLYSRGFRMDFESFKLVKTGGIYIKSVPSDAQISIDGEYVENKSGIFQNGTLITNIMPGDYKAVVSRDGYSPWDKLFTVRPGGVSVFDSIMLFPEDGWKTVYEGEVSELYAQKSGVVFESGGGVFFGKRKFTGNELVSFSKNGSVITKKAGSYYLSRIGSSESSLNLTMMFDSLKESRLNLPGPVGITDIIPYQFSDQKFVISTKRGLYLLDTEKPSIEQISAAKTAYAVSGSDLIWADENGVYSLDLILKTRVNILTGEAMPGSVINVIASPQNSKNVLALGTESGELLLFENGTMRKISANYKDVSFSPDGKIAVFTEGDSLTALFVEPELKEKERTFLFIPDGGVSKMMWHRSGSYIFVRDGAGSVFFTEVDDSPNPNVLRIATGASDFSYSEDDKLLYISDGSGIRSIKI